MNLYDLAEQADWCRNRHGYNPNSLKANIIATPGKASMRLKIVAYITLQGRYGATLHEVAEHLGVAVNRISGRFLPLRLAEKIFDSGTTRATPSGAMAAVYVSRKEWCS